VDLVNNCDAAYMVQVDFGQGGDDVTRAAMAGEAVPQDCTAWVSNREDLRLPPFDHNCAAPGQEAVLERMEGRLPGQNFTKTFPRSLTLTPTQLLKDMIDHVDPGPVSSHKDALIRAVYISFMRTSPEEVTVSSTVLIDLEERVVSVPMDFSLKAGSDSFMLATGVKSPELITIQAKRGVWTTGGYFPDVLQSLVHIQGDTADLDVGNINHTLPIVTAISKLGQVNSEGKAAVESVQAANRLGAQWKVIAAGALTFAGAGCESKASQGEDTG